MSNKTVKLGVVGLGRGLDVVKEVVGADGVQIIAICDRNAEKLENAKKVFSDLGVTELQSFDNFEDFITADFDAVFIATDAIYHVPYVIKAMDAGKHVISEIPAVNSLEEAKALKAAVKSHPELKYMSAENCCYWEFIETWKKMYDDGKFGQAVYAESEYIHCADYRDFKAEDFPADHWRQFNPAIKYITHNLGPLLYIMDDKCVSVTCFEPDIMYNPYKKNPAAQNGVALFKTAKGAVIRILICFGAYAGFTHEFQLYGTRGNISTDRTKPMDDAHSFGTFSDIPMDRDKKIEIPVALSSKQDAQGGHGGADRKMMLAFIKCILEDTPPPIDVDLGIRMALPGILAHESAEQGGAPIAIPDIE